MNSRILLAVSRDLDGVLEALAAALRLEKTLPGEPDQSEAISHLRRALEDLFGDTLPDPDVEEETLL